MTEKEQLRRLKAFVGDITSNKGIVDSFNSILDASLRHGLFNKVIHHEPCGKLCTCGSYVERNDNNANWEDGIECGMIKADWLKDGNDQPQP